jgi:glutathione peroxidase-family protein
MTAKLTDITPSYISFEDDQVLTAKQMNTFLNYFDDQDRMSRICLSGVGIVCGFEVKYNTVENPNVLVLTQGCGFTTDGDLFHLWENIGNEGLKTFDFDQIIYDTYVSFTDNKALYKPYFYNGEDQIELWELLPVDSIISGQAISDKSDLNDMVVLLYLESYPQDSDLCVGINCDNLGVKEVQNLRVLMVSKANADHILSYDQIFSPQDLFETYMDLNDVVVPRVILDQANTFTLNAMKTAYQSAILSDNIVSDLQESILDMLTKVGMDTVGIDINTQIGTLFSSGTMPDQFFQYKYDLFKDVVDTYMEMKELFLHSSTDCCPDIKSFPKHLFLGVLVPTEQDILYKNYRHSFYKSPILGHGHENFEKFKSLVDRLKNQLGSYISGTLATTVKITPSKFGTHPLGDKAIPFYYKLSNQNVEEPLLKSWNYEKTLVNKQGRNLSYHTALLQNTPAIQTPLKYNLEPYNFLRIEGGQGLTYTNAISQINALKTANGLSFDLKALGITIPSTATVNVEDYPCEFSDLNAMLQSWRAEYECILGNASHYLSGYSVISPWENARANYYYDVQLKKDLPLSSLGSSNNNPIEDNLDRTENTVGKFLGDTYQTYVGCSANDLIFQTFQSMKGLRFNLFNPYQYHLTIRGPVEILAHSLELFRDFPRTLLQWTPVNFNNISLNASYICSLARNYQGVADGNLPTPPMPAQSVSYPRSESSSSNQSFGYRSNQLPIFNLDFNEDFSRTPVDTEPVMTRLIMNQVLTICCSLAKLQEIMDQIEERKQRILLNQRLSEFIKKHPGLEHFAGTKQGGTFLLVYTSTAIGSIPANTVVADFSLPYLCCSDCS